MTIITGNNIQNVSFFDLGQLGSVHGRVGSVLGQFGLV